MTEHGLDLHDWTTRWEQFMEDARDAPDEALPELVRLIEEMLVHRGFQLDEPVTAEGEDIELLKMFFAAREKARLAEEGIAEQEDIETALEDLQWIYEYLTVERAPP